MGFIPIRLLKLKATKKYFYEGRETPPSREISVDLWGATRGNGFARSTNSGRGGVCVFLRVCQVILKKKPGASPGDDEYQLVTFFRPGRNVQGIRFKSLVDPMSE